MDETKFFCDDIFREPSLAFNICQDDTPEVLSLQPKQLYQSIKTLAEARYQYKLLPKKMGQLKCLETENNKVSLLRDVCRSIGLTLNLKGLNNEVNSFILTNDTDKLRQSMSAQVHKAKISGQKKQKKGSANVPQLSDEELFVSENLPFKPSDIADFYPILKSLEVNNRDVQGALAEAKNALADNQLERAFELYSQSINILLQVTGSMNEEVAQCIAKMASI